MVLMQGPVFALQLPPKLTVLTDYCSMYIKGLFISFISLTLLDLITKKAHYHLHMVQVSPARHKLLKPDMLNFVLFKNCFVLRQAYTF